MGMTIPDNVNAGDEALATWANAVVQTLRDLSSNESNDFIGASVAGSVLTITRRNGATVTVNLPSGGGGTTLPSYTQIATLVLKSRNNILFWEGVNEVPDTPGTQSGIGHVLTVSGENDMDYRWDPLPNDNARFNQIEENVSELQTELQTASGSIADANTQRAEGDDIQSVTISSSSSYQATLTSQLGSAKPLLLVIASSISGTRNSESYSYNVGDVLYFTPTSDRAEFLFNLPQSSGGPTSGLNQAQVDARVRALVADWAEQGNTGRLPEAKITQSLLDAVSGNTGNIQTNSNLVSALNRTVSSLTTEVDTLHPKIGRLVPITPWVRNNEARTLQFAWFPLAAVSTSDTLRMSIGGVAHTPTVSEGYAATDVSGIVCLLYTSPSPRDS